MKLTNRQQNNFFTVDSAVMRGSIEMSLKEFETCWKHLLQQYEKAIKNTDTYIRDTLSTTIMGEYRYWHAINTNKPFCLHVTATKLIVKKYKLPRYKDQNYAIIIK